MNYTLETSIGIDSVIESVKADVYDGLENIFPNAKIDAFGRVYRNRKDIGVVPEYLIDDEYRDVYIDDSKDILFSFLVSNTSETEDEWVFANEVKIIFFLNLKRLYGQYIDSKAHMEIVDLLRSLSKRRYAVKSVETGIDNVLSGFYTEKIKNADISPWHFFSVGVRMYYNLNC